MNIPFKHSEVKLCLFDAQATDWPYRMKTQKRIQLWGVGGGCKRQVKGKLWMFFGAQNHLYKHCT